MWGSSLSGTTAQPRSGSATVEFVHNDDSTGQCSPLAAPPLARISAVAQIMGAVGLTGGVPRHHAHIISAKKWRREQRTSH